MDSLKHYCEYIKKEEMGIVLTDVCFKNITTLKVGGKIGLLFYPNSYDNFVKFYHYYLKRDNSKIDDLFIIGNGSNVLANDLDYNGIVVCFKYIKTEIEIKYFENDYYLVCADSGTKLSALSKKLIKNCLLDGEFLQFIPGLLGGAITMNASCYGMEMANVIYRVECIDKNGNVKWYNRDDLNFSYRNSLIKKNKLIILKVEMVFKKGGNQDTILSNIEKYKDLKKISQPIGDNSAGSVFKNKENKKAWEIVEELGFKGYSIGGCRVSPKHSNFIINDNNAKAIDVYNLMRMIKNEYLKRYNDNLECEWVLVNFDEKDVKNI